MPFGEQDVDTTPEEAAARGASIGTDALGAARRQSIAQTQLQMGMGQAQQNIAQQAIGGGPLGQRAAIYAGGQMQSGMSQQAALLRAQELTQARGVAMQGQQNLAQVGMQQRGLDLQERGQNMALVGAGLGAAGAVGAAGLKGPAAVSDPGMKRAVEELTLENLRLSDELEYQTKFIEPPKGKSASLRLSRQSLKNRRAGYDRGRPPLKNRSMPGPRTLTPEQEAWKQDLYEMDYSGDSPHYGDEWAARARALEHRGWWLEMMERSKDPDSLHQAFQASDGTYWVNSDDQYWGPDKYHHEGWDQSPGSRKWDQSLPFDPNYPLKSDPSPPGRGKWKRDRYLPNHNYYGDRLDRAVIRPEPEYWEREPPQPQWRQNRPQGTKFRNPQTAPIEDFGWVDPPITTDYVPPGSYVRSYPEESHIRVPENDDLDTEWLDFDIEPASDQMPPVEHRGGLGELLERRIDGADLDVTGRPTAPFPPFPSPKISVEEAEREALINSGRIPMEDPADFDYLVRQSVVASPGPSKKDIVPIGRESGYQGPVPQAAAPVPQAAAPAPVAPQAAPVPGSEDDCKGEMSPEQAIACATREFGKRMEGGADYQDRARAPMPETPPPPKWSETQPGASSFQSGAPQNYSREEYMKQFGPGPGQGHRLGDRIYAPPRSEPFFRELAGLEDRTTDPSAKRMDQERSRRQLTPAPTYGDSAQQDFGYHEAVKGPTAPYGGVPMTQPPKQEPYRGGPERRGGGADTGPSVFGGVYGKEGQMGNPYLSSPAAPAAPAAQPSPPAPAINPSDPRMKQQVYSMGRADSVAQMNADVMERNPQELSSIVRETPLVEYEYNEEAQDKWGMPPGRRTGTLADKLAQAGPYGRSVTTKTEEGLQMIKPDEGIGTALGMAAAVGRENDELERRIRELEASVG